MVYINCKVDYKREGSPRRSRERSGEREPARRRDSDEDRLERAERRLRYEEQRFKERKVDFKRTFRFSIKFIKRIFCVKSNVKRNVRSAVASLHLLQKTGLHH